MNILITGATGYLGSMITHALTGDHRILCPVLSDDPCDRLADIRDTVLLTDTGDAMERAIRTFQPAAVIHTAVVYDRGGVDTEPVLQANLLFPLRILPAAAKHGMHKWINTDSALPDTMNAYSLAKSQFRQWGRTVCQTQSDFLCQPAA